MGPEKLLRTVYGEWWMIKPAVHANIRRLLDIRLKRMEEPMPEREGEDFCGEKITLRSMEVVDGVAHIPFAGVLVKGASGWQKGSGAIAHADIERDIRWALDSKDVAAILFDTDSPGGTAAGTPALAKLIAQAANKKPTMAWVEDLCCSAALFALSGCGLMYGNETSEVGAVETYLAIFDWTAAYDEAGVKVEVIANSGGDFVAAGYPGTKLTDDQRDQFKAQVDQIFAMYVSHLEKARPAIQRSSMRGQTFIGDAATDVGMLDCVTTKDQAVRDLRKWAGLTTI